MPYVTSFERIAMARERQAGLVQGLQEGIASVLETRFGSASKRLASKVQAIQEVERLRELMRVAQVADSLNDLRRLLG